VSNKIHSPEGVERLRTLYSIMFGVPSEKVNMSGWRFAATERDLTKGCGTAACAVGWACSYPEFQAQGLSYGVSPAFNGLTSWDAVLEFFAVDAHVAAKLFQTTEVGLEAKRGVLSRIRHLLLENGVISHGRSLELFDQESALLE